MIDYLKRHPGINIIILAIYYVLVVVTHEWVGLAVVTIFKGVSMENYNLICGAVSIVVFIGVVGFLLSRLIKHPQRALIATYLFMTLIFMVLCFYLLFIFNVEAIHFAQYAMFVILAYPLLRSATSLIIIACIAGAIDEGYQYWILSPDRTPYYDFNDVIINTVGAGFGLLIVKLMGYNFGQIKKWINRSEVYLLGLLTAVFALLYGMGYMSIYQDLEAPTRWTLVREVMEGFWYDPPGKPGNVHVVKPLEGVLIVIGLWVFYGLWDYWDRTRCDENN